MSEATDENEFDLAIAVFREGMHIDKEEEDRSDRVDTYRGTRAARYVGWLLEMQYLGSDGSNLEIYSVTDREPVEISKNRRNVEKARFLGNDPSKCVPDKLQASHIRSRCASKERVTVVESRTHYRGSYCLASLRGEGRSDVTECTDVKVRCLACFGILFVKRHPRVKMNTKICG